MAIMNIVAPLTGSKDDSIVLETAFAAAAPFKAHVSAIFCRPDSREAIPITEVPLLPEVVQELVDIQENLTKTAKAAAHAAFNRCAQMAGAKIALLSDRSGAVTASYCEFVGHQPSVIEENSFLADLIVFPPLSHTFNEESQDTFVRLLTRSERPVLLAPVSSKQIFGKRIAIGWDGSRPAAHALMAALPFLEKAEQVSLLSVLRHGAPTSLDIARAKDYLHLHGIPCNDKVIEDTIRPIGETLLNAAVEAGCDMLVVGGYGHSRLAESIFGGVTAHIASHPAIPILMMH